MDSDQPDKRFIRRIKLENLLSFGPDTPPLELQNLNILIGPNASSKSNLIEALSLMRSTPASVSSDSNLQGVIRRGGGASEWVWKGGRGQRASLEFEIGYSKEPLPLAHILSFHDAQMFHLDDERVESQASLRSAGGFSFYYRFEHGQAVIRSGGEFEERKLPYVKADNVSILAQLRDPEQYPEIAYLADSYEKIRIYREWTFGRHAILREPQSTGGRTDRLEEDFSNFGVFLSRLRRAPKAKTEILEGLRDLYDGVTDFDIDVQTAHVHFTESDFSVPATRLSDGTLRYLCLLAILCDPEPPPLICIEEPELGLHPDILPKLADLLVLASQRTQLIVTTHSDILVDAMTERPEVVVVCEKHAHRTEMRRLKRDDLARWLEKYRLGQLWIRGDIGGTRW